MRRYTERSLPPYTYVPGKTPHPVSDPGGHQHGESPPEVAKFSPADWLDCEPYLFGVDLFNAGFYWEAHEQWEAVWIGAGRQGTTADFLKGLIKWAAAGVKQLEGREEGTRRHARRAAELFRAVAERRSQEVMLGLRFEDLESSALQLSRDTSSSLPLLTLSGPSP